MSMNLVEQAKDFVEKLFKDKLSSLYTYHNLKHTTDVVSAVSKLSDSQNNGHAACGKSQLWASGPLFKSGQPNA